MPTQPQIVLLAALGFFAWFHLLGALIAGLVGYGVTAALARGLRQTTQKSEQTLAAWGMGLLLLVLITLGIVALGEGIAGFDPARLEGQFTRLVTAMLEGLPAVVQAHLPDTPAGVVGLLKTSVQEHLSEIFRAGKSLAGGVLLFLVSFLVGILAAEADKGAPSENPLVTQLRGFLAAFELALLTQVKLAVLYTLLTSLYVLVAVPAFGYEFTEPYLLIGLTFMFGLIPVIGNLAANVSTLLLSLKIAMPVAVASLVFLVTIHKLEYILIGKFMGRKQQVPLWKILATMVVFEHIAGLPGVLLAPVVVVWLSVK